MVSSDGFLEDPRKEGACALLSEGETWRLSTGWRTSQARSRRADTKACSKPPPHAPANPRANMPKRRNTHLAKPGSVRVWRFRSWRHGNELRTSSESTSRTYRHQEGTFVRA